jgi:SAM-dependent methyltransferase
MYKMRIADNAYDVVLVEQSPAPFLPLETVLRTISRSLKPDGLFILHEFVGPSAFNGPTAADRGQQPAADSAGKI